MLLLFRKKKKKKTKTDAKVKNKTKPKTYCHPEAAPGVETGHVEVGGNGHIAPVHFTLMSGDRAFSLQICGLQGGFSNSHPLQDTAFKL